MVTSSFSVHILYGKGKYLNQTFFYKDCLPNLYPKLDPKNDKNGKYFQLLTFLSNFFFNFSVDLVAQNVVNVQKGKEFVVREAFLKKKQFYCEKMPQF